MTSQTYQAGSGLFRIGLISDTHGLLRPEAVEYLRGSDHILHAGDIGKPEILHALREGVEAPQHGGQQAAFDEVRRMIREDEPPRPSTLFR